MDLARFAESNGGDNDRSYNHAWRYRQYVIDAFNADMLFDQFITEQLAGDLIAADSDADRLRQVTATGLLAIGQKSLVNDKVVEYADENLDVISKSMLGLSATCARCHDHKFDPIPQVDYYALSGILQNTQWLIGEMSKGNEPVTLSKELQWIFAGPPSNPQKLQKMLAKAEAIVGKSDADQKSDGGGKGKQLSVDTRNAMLLVQKLKREIDGQVPVIAVIDKPNPKDAPLLRGGDPKNEEATVPRGFLSAVKLVKVTQVDPKQSGRLQLAQWVTNPQNPLTPRVAANRVWLHLFGKGLVSTPDNFGSTGSLPSHPELLDYLASRFVERGWSHKKLIRELMLSRADRSTSWAYSPTRKNELAAMASAHEADPDNSLYWRMNLKRLEVESLRDSMLAASGQLDRDPAHRSIMEDIGVTSFEGNDRRGDPKVIEREQFVSRHRSIYLPILRSIEPPMFSVFDFPSPVLATGQRSITSVPPQALFLMNNPWVHEQTNALARSLLAQEGSDKERLSEAWLRVLARTVRIDELARAQHELAELRSIKPALPEETIWALVVHSLFLTTEFRDLY